MNRDRERKERKKGRMTEKKETMKRKKKRKRVKKRKRKRTIVFIFLKLPPTGFAGFTGSRDWDVHGGHGILTHGQVEKEYQREGTDSSNSLMRFRCEQ